MQIMVNYSFALTSCYDTPAKRSRTKSVRQPILTSNHTTLCATTVQTYSLTTRRRTWSTSHITTDSTTRRRRVVDVEDGRTGCRTAEWRSMRDIEMLQVAAAKKEEEEVQIDEVHIAAVINGNVNPLKILQAKWRSKAEVYFSCYC